MTQDRPKATSKIQVQRATSTQREELVAGLHARGVCYLAPTPHGDEAPISDDELIAGITLADDARLRFALAGLFLLRPDLATRAVVIEPTLSEPQRAELRKQYIAAMYLQRLWRTRLRLQFGETTLIPEHYTTELHLPSPELMHGELGLRTLCERSSYNDWSSYDQVIDLLCKQPCTAVADSERLTDDSFAPADAHAPALYDDKHLGTDQNSLHSSTLPDDATLH